MTAGEGFDREELFFYVAGQLPPERAEQIAAACRDDEELAARVELYRHFAGGLVEEKNTPASFAPIEITTDAPRAHSDGVYAPEVERFLVAVAERVRELQGSEISSHPMLQPILIQPQPLTWKGVLRESVWNRRRFQTAAVIVLAVTAIVMGAFWLRSRQAFKQMKTDIEDNILLVKLVSARELFVKGDLGHPLFFQLEGDDFQTWRTFQPTTQHMSVPGVASTIELATDDEGNRVIRFVFDESYAGPVKLEQNGKFAVVEIREDSFTNNLRVLKNLENDCSVRLQFLQDYAFLNGGWDLSLAAWLMQAWKPIEDFVNSARKQSEEHERRLREEDLSDSERDSMQKHIRQNEILVTRAEQFIKAHIERQRIVMEQLQTNE